MEAQNINIRDISHTATIDEVIRMVLRSDVTDLSQYALFVVNGKKEKRVKTIETLLQLQKGNIRANSAILTVKRKLKTKSIGSKVLKVKKTINRLKTIFSRDSRRQQNNLNFTKTRNMNDGNNLVSKSAGDKLTDIENLLQSETILMTGTPEAEMFGKFELFRRFMKDVNDSLNDANETINDVDSAINYVNNFKNDVRKSLHDDIYNSAYITDHRDETDTFVISNTGLQKLSDTRRIPSRFNDAFIQLNGYESTFLEVVNDTTYSIEELNDAFTRSNNTSIFLNTRTDTTNLTTHLNEAFVTSYISVPLLNYGIIYTSLHQDETAENVNKSRFVSDSSEIFNECFVLNESHDTSECSESAFGDDNEIDDLERNIFDEDFVANVEDVRIFFNESRLESTDDAIDSFMNSVSRHHDDDEGLSSTGSDATGE